MTIYNYSSIIIITGYNNVFYTCMLNQLQHGLIVMQRHAPKLLSIYSLDFHCLITINSSYIPPPLPQYIYFFIHVNVNYVYSTNVWVFQSCMWSTNHMQLYNIIYTAHLCRTTRHAIISSKSTPAPCNRLVGETKWNGIQRLKVTLHTLVDFSRLHTIMICVQLQAVYTPSVDSIHIQAHCPIIHVSFFSTMLSQHHAEFLFLYPLLQRIFSPVWLHVSLQQSITTIFYRPSLCLPVNIIFLSCLHHLIHHYTYHHHHTSIIMHLN